MTKISISIIVPVYKSEKTLLNCVNSILNQSYKDLEIILVNDGSPDKCGEICDNFAEIDKRVKVVHKENGGVSSARNEGLKAATGEFIGFVDSDDWIEQDMIIDMFNVIEETDADLAICGYFEENAAGITKAVSFPINKKTLFTTKSALEFVLSNMNMAAVWNKLYRRDLITKNKITFDESITIGEDLLFLTNCIYHSKKIVFDPKPQYHYVLMEDSAMNSSFKPHKLTVIRAHNEISKLLEDRYKSLLPIVEHRLISVCINLIIIIFASNQADKVLFKDPRIHIKNGLKEYLKSENSIKMKIYAVLIAINPNIFGLLWGKLSKKS